MSGRAQEMTTLGSTGDSWNLSLVEARSEFSRLEAYAIGPEALDAPLDEVEREMDRRMREVARLTLQANIDRRGTGDQGPALTVTDSGGEPRRYAARREDKRGITSLFGKVSVRRRAYAAAGCPAVHPLDAPMRLPARSLSYQMQRRVVEEAVRGPFDEAVEAVEKYTGNRVAKRTAEQLTVDKAADFDAFYEQRKGPPAGETGPLLVAAVDGKGVPVVKPAGATRSIRRKKGEKANKKKIATVAAVFTQQPRIRTPEEVVASLFDDAPPDSGPRVRPEHKRVWASLAKPQEDVFGEVAAEMVARDPGATKARVMVTDGERRLRRMAEKTLPDVRLVLDFLHVLEYLWKAAHALYDEGTKEAEAWVRERALRLLRGEVSQVVKGMRRSATVRKLSQEREKAIRRSADYFYRNRDRMRYHEYLAAGFPIASGAVEGACKNLVKDRMERSGMRWRFPGAEALLKLRAIRLSGDFDEYWQFHLQQEQTRLYGRRQWKAAA